MSGLNKGSKLNQSDYDIDQQSINIFMQYITNKVDSQGQFNDNGIGAGSSDGKIDTTHFNDQAPRIDPKLLEQLINIEHEEDECSDSEQDGDDNSHDIRSDRGSSDDEDVNEDEDDEDEDYGYEDDERDSQDDDEEEGEDDDDVDEDYGDEDEDDYGDEDEMMEVRQHVKKAFSTA
jgi:hypothetical protein